jgi:hypothetical protein
MAPQKLLKILPDKKKISITIHNNHKRESILIKCNLHYNINGTPSQNTVSKNNASIISLYTTNAQHIASNNFQTDGNIDSE